MSSKIDERIVSMKFDNRQFESGMKSSMSLLDRLKSALRLDGVGKGLDDISKQASRFSLKGMADGVDGISAKFAALTTIGVTALATITTKAVDAGLQLVKSLTLGPISEGFSDYNAKLTSVQTIMNATGASMKTVNGYFTELDTYADKTIYNLTDMTDSFAKFTNAGVGMDKSVPAIKGIANMVALAGQNSQAASIAMYNLSQSIAGGFLTTTDYKSLNLANVATKEWKDQMIAAAVSAGKLKKSGKDAYTIAGSSSKTAYTSASLFNEALSEGWASADVLLKVLGDYGDETTAIGKKALGAAQDVKSLPMMMDTLKASVGTGWTESFELIFGNVEEATVLFTGMTNAIGGVLDAMSKGRNDFLRSFIDAGGKTAVIDTFKNLWTAVSIPIKAIGDAWRSVFPANGGAGLAAVAKAIENFTEKLKMGGTMANNLKRTFAGFFAVLSIGWQIVSGVISTVFKIFSSLFGLVGSGSGGILATTGSIADLLVAVDKWLKKTNAIGAFFDAIASGTTFVIVPLVKAVQAVATAFQKAIQGDFTGAFDSLGVSLDFLRGLLDSVVGAASAFWAKISAGGKSGATKLNAAVQSIVDLYERVKAMVSFKFPSWNLQTKGIDAGSRALDGLKAAGEGAKTGLQTVRDFIGGVVDFIQRMGQKIQPYLKSVADLFKTITDRITEYISNLNFNDAIALVNTGMFILAYKAFKDFFSHLKTITGTVTDSFEQLTETLSAMQKSVQAGIVLKIAIAVGVLVAALYVLSKVDARALIQGIIAIGILMKMLNMSMGYLSELEVADNAKIMTNAAGMILLAIAINVLATAVKKLGEVDTGELIKGLIAVSVLLAGLTLFSKYAQADSTSLSSGAGLILLAGAVYLLSISVEKFGKMDIGTLLKGMYTIMAIISALAVMVRVMNGTSGVFTAAAGLLLLTGALLALSVVLKVYAMMDFGTIAEGLVAVGLALVVIGATMRGMSPKSAIGLTIAAAALIVLAGALKLMATIGLADMIKVMIALTVVLTALSVALILMSGTLSGSAALLVAAAALTVFAAAMVLLSTISWENILKGIVAITALLTVITLFGVLMAAFPPILAGLIGFATALQMLGTAMLLAGTGFMLLAVGFATFAAIGTAGFAVITAAIISFLNLLPLIGQQIGLAMVAFAVVIENAGPRIVGALTTLFNSMLQAAINVLPKFEELITKLIKMVLRILQAAIPAMTSAGLNILVGILRGIANNIGRVITAATDIIVNFLKGLQNNLPRIIDQGAKTVIAFINGVANAIRGNSSQLQAAAGNLGDAIIDGVVNAVKNGIGAVKDAAWAMAKGALKSAMGALKINSPSKEFRDKVGRGIPEGVAVGIRTYDHYVTKEIKSFGVRATNTMSKALSGMGSAVGIDLVSPPTVRPVLDLTTVKRDAEKIGRIISGQRAAIRPTIEMARSAYDPFRYIEKGAKDNIFTGKTPTQINYTQNNYSPKALSNADIYRQTNTQLSGKVRGALKIA